MSNVHEINSKEKAIEQASLWVAKLDRELSEQETQQLQAWLDSSTVNKATFLEVVQVWDKLESLSKLGLLFETQAQTSFWQRNKILASAASVAFAALISLSVYLLSSPIQEIKYQREYATQIGEYSNFTLQDNTQLYLNTNSLVRVTYTDKQRLLELVKGELFVDVAHDSTKPLNVIARNTVIQAVGTAFNVELKEGRVELVVTDGKVLVEQDLDFVNTPLLQREVNLPASSLSLKEGQFAHITSHLSNTLVDSTDRKAVESHLAWQNGELIFRGEKLDAAIKEISRYTDLTFTFKEQRLKEMQIAGLFKTNDIEAFLSALQSNFDIKVIRADGRVLLSGS
ncbi:FecR family protein [Glaciecola sp. KUL10]|uniref:FecR family protein n=1 Tax=Glaciecola sp. (strain KUL10) TaxID=2161813 RepID=UPI000D787009|nr:FecR domain-containing protein [Glaciecola sp. KUL10]GBL04348.1 transmembrane sensor [Glaciecola sp. KUL10]